MRGVGHGWGFARMMFGSMSGSCFTAAPVTERDRTLNPYP